MLLQKIESLRGIPNKTKQKNLCGPHLGLGPVLNLTSENSRRPYL